MPEQLLSFSLSRVPPPAYPTTAHSVYPGPLVYRSQQDVTGPPPLIRPVPLVGGGLLRNDDDVSSEMFSVVAGDPDSAGAGVYSALPGAVPSLDDVQLNELSRNSLHFVEKIGEGRFGEVRILQCRDFWSRSLLIPLQNTSSTYNVRKTIF